jgi:hypothetical protein
MKISAKFGQVVAGVLVVMTGAFSSKSDASDPQLELQQCVDSCNAFYGEPGPGLKKCVQDCLKASDIPNSAAKCETYENCEDDGGRGGGPDDPSDDGGRGGDGDGGGL